MTELERRRPETCLSDLRLDQLLAGELPDAEVDGTRAHLASCSVCAARLAEVEAGRAAFLAAPPAWRRRPARRPARWLIPSGAAALAAAAALLVIVGGGHGPGTRTKGTVRLGLYVKHGDAVRRAGPGEVVRPGDALRFIYTTASPQHVAVLSLDGVGHASIYYPDGPTAVRHPPGVEVPLPRSTVLDEVVGREVLYGLFCNEAIVLEPLRQALESSHNAPPVPPHCTLDQLEIVKERVP